MSDDATRTRFLGAIAAQLPIHRVIEVHLFGPIKQGGMESGVAVIAVDPNEPVPAEPAPVVQDEVAEAPHAEGGHDAGHDVEHDVVPVEPSVEAVLEEPVVRADGQVADPDAPPADESDASDHAGYDAPVDETPLEEPAAPRAAAPRYTVYTARYRLTLKGPDRGKWDASVTEEADAPLLTVDAVVRGVSRRSGEADETVRLSGDEFRAALPEPAPAPAPPTRAPLAGRRG